MKIQNATVTLEKSLWFLKKLSTCIPITQQFNSREMRNIHPNFYTNFHSNFIHNSKKLETLQYPSTNESINNMYMYLFNKILLNNGN